MLLTHKLGYTYLIKFKTNIIIIILFLFNINWIRFLDCFQSPNPINTVSFQYKLTENQQPL